MEALEENFPELRSSLLDWRCEDRQAASTYFLSYKIYEHIDECETYDEAVGVLDDILKS